MNIEEYREIKSIIDKLNPSLGLRFTMGISDYVFDKHWESVEEMNNELLRFCAYFFLGKTKANNLLGDGRSWMSGLGKGNLEKLPEEIKNKIIAYALLI
jgi:hypothetical protein